MNQSKKKIGIVSNLIYPLFNKTCKSEIFGGGAAVQLYNISKELAKNESLDVNVITGNNNFTDNKIERIHNITLHNIRPIKRKLSYYFLSLLNFFITLVNLKPDIIIQRGYNKITGICALYCRIYRKKLIFSIAHIGDVNGSRERGFFGKIFRYGLNRADYIIAQNNDQIVALEKHIGKKLRNVSVIQNCYEIHKIQNREKTHILWVGRAINFKRPELFIELAKKFPNKKFLMICNKSDQKSENIKYWNDLKQKCFKISNLAFIDYVPYHEIDDYFKKAKIFVNTSTHEGFPNTFIQAFLNKTPVISLNVNPDEFLTNNEVGIFCKNNFQEMVNSLDNLLKNEALYNSLAKNCYEYIKKTHDIKHVILSWIEIIKNS